MKAKKKGILTACVIIVAAAVLLAVFSPKIKNGIWNLGVAGFTDKDISNVDSIVLLAHCSEVEGKTNSVAGFKEAVRLGADAVAVDLCFRTDGTPVMSDRYENVDSAPLLEDLFKAMKEERFLNAKVFLNIVQLSDLSALNRLAVDYSLVGRLFLMGIDKAHYGLITSDDTIIPFYINYEFTLSDSADIDDGTFGIPAPMEKYGASGLVIKRSDCTEKNIEALNDYGIPVLVTDVSNGSQLCSVLSKNAKTVYVENITKSKTVLDKWIAEMQSRFESSVEQSLKDLSTSVNE